MLKDLLQVLGKIRRWCSDELRTIDINVSPSIVTGMWSCSAIRTTEEPSLPYNSRLSGQGGLLLARVLWELSMDLYLIKVHGADTRWSTWENRKLRPILVTWRLYNSLNGWWSVWTPGDASLLLPRGSSEQHGSKVPRLLAAVTSAFSHWSSKHLV